MRIYLLLSVLLALTLMAGLQVYALEAHSLADQGEGKIGSKSPSTNNSARIFRAHLDGDQVVPSVRSTASGVAVFTPTADGTAIRYWLRIRNVENMAGANLEFGPRGSNGVMLVNLTPTTTWYSMMFFFGSGPMDLLIQGVIEDGDLRGELENKTVGDLLEVLDLGLAYVNVMTVQNPGGEIRGQVD